MMPEPDKQSLQPLLHVTSNDKDAFVAVISESLFIILPFFIITMVLSYKNQLMNLGAVPEWSLAAAVLFGQAIVKIIVASIKIGNTGQGRLSTESITLLVTIGIVLGLVPSLVLLVMVQLSASPPAWVVYMQIVMFILALVFYLLMGAAAESSLRDLLDHLNKEADSKTSPSAVIPKSST